LRARTSAKRKRRRRHECAQQEGYANLPTTANSGEKNIYENGKLTHYGKSLIAKDQAATGGAAAGGGSGAFGSQAEKEAYIRQMAAQIGMDPDTAMRVARSEGFKDFSGDSGTSFGAFQLHVTPNGRGHAVGDQFRHDTGLDPSDPANERQVIDYALQWARKHGWGDFHGAARTGIGQWQGVGSTTDVQIGSVTISAGGSLANRQALLESIEAIIGSLDLFDAVTPEKTYSSVNPTHRDYHRSAENGQGLLVVDLHCELVNESVESEFGNTQSPTGAGQNDNGQVQPQDANNPPTQEAN
jgi:hypothetical protein